MTSVTTQTVKYPTDPLVASEVDAVSAAIKAHTFFAPLFNPVDPINTAIFVELLLKEPLKSDVIAFDINPVKKRKARALVYLNTNNKTYEVIVSLPEIVGQPILQSYITYSLVNKTMYPYNNYDQAPIDDAFGGAQCYPYFTRDELIAKVLANPTLMSKLARRNVTRAMLTDPYPCPDSSHPRIYPYAFYTFESFRNFVGAAGASCPDLLPLATTGSGSAPNHRYMPVVFFDQTIIPGGICIETANWGFVEGIFLIVDCNDKTNWLFRIVDDGPLPPIGAPPIVPAVPDPYPVIAHPPMKRLCTTMPDGVSFDVPADDIHKVMWDNWEFRWSYQRSGLTLYQVYYTEKTPTNPGGDKRKILYKNAASDTLVVYNAKEPNVTRTYVSADSHNWPILQRLQTLVPGRDCPAHAKLYPIVTFDCTGASRVIDDAVAIYEQENDLLWRVNQGVINFNSWPNATFDAQGNSVDYISGCRKRQLVVRTIFSGFYYLFCYSYTFSQDGSMECFCDLFGQTTNQWVESDDQGTETPYGQRIALQMLALNHTHSVMWRMDFDIDSMCPNGGGNSVSEQNAYRITDTTENKCGQVIKVVETEFLKEKDASRQHNMATNRSWSVHNPNSTNRLGFERGFELFGLSPNGNCVSLSRDDSAAHSHLSYLKNHLHVTKYRYGEEFASGEFPVLADLATNGGTPPGMETYLANNESIKNTDIVLWYNAMFFHKPHTCDAPFISGHRLGCLLVPENFFGMNPACSLNQETTLVRKGDDTDGSDSSEGHHHHPNAPVIGECGRPKLFTFADCPPGPVVCPPP